MDGTLKLMYSLKVNSEKKISNGISLFIVFLNKILKALWILPEAIIFFGEICKNKHFQDAPENCTIGLCTKAPSTGCSLLNLNMVF